MNISEIMLLGLGLLVGGSLVFVLLASTQQSKSLDESVERESIIDGVSEILEVLATAGLVVARSGSVLRSTNGALALGLVNNRALIHKKLQEIVEEAFVSADPVSVEATLPSGLRGNSIWVHVRAAKITEETVLLLLDDRTEAHRLDETRRDFIANVSHELKTPIGAISLLAEALQDAGDNPEMVRKFSKDLYRESKRLGALVKDIIQLSRLQAAEISGNAQMVELHEVITEAIELNQLAADTRNVKLEVEAPEQVYVVGDQSMLVTAVRNLIENAITYSDDNAQVGIGLSVSDGIAEIAVTDSGVGIPAAEQDRIFERFYRVDPSRSRQTGGTGLGLSIVKHVAHNHRGEISLFSKPGVGSTFTLRIPIAGAAAVGKQKNDKKKAQKKAKGEKSKSEKKKDKK